MRPGSPQRGGSARRAAQPSAATAAAMAGAVDLAAVKARSEAAARAATAPPPAATDVVVDVTEATFQSAVLDRSFQVPVLIDLWAEWCQPCKQLSPVLEKLAAESAGSWVLAKIDVEANPRLQQALQVQSIPAVFAVIGGQLVPGFQGALPEAQVREFVQAVLDAGAQAGLSGPGAVPAETGQPADGDAAAGSSSQVGPGAPGSAAAPEQPEDPRFVAAEQALDAGDYALATRRYQAILDAEPANDDARLALGQVALMARLESVDQTTAARADAAPDDVDAQLAAADLALASNDVAGALDRLLAAVGRFAGDDRDRVRARLVEFFELLGADDPHVPAARRALARALF